MKNSYKRRTMSTPTGRDGKSVLARLGHKLRHSTGNNVQGTPMENESCQGLGANNDCKIKKILLRTQCPGLRSTVSSICLHPPETKPGSRWMRGSRNTFLNVDLLRVGQPFKDPVLRKGWTRGFIIRKPVWRNAFQWQWII